MDQVPEDGREEAVKVKELSILKLGSVLAKHGFAEGEHVAHLRLTDSYSTGLRSTHIYECEAHSHLSYRCEAY